MPEKIPQPPDQDQRDIILDELDATILVEAAAGTGKTTSMVGRMVNLLARGRASIDSIAAVTFTRKAAAELRSRFQVQLEHTLLGTDNSVQRARIQASIDHIERCFIGTIHSFCGKLLRDRPIEAGVDLRFVEIDDEEDAELRRQAWRQYVSDLYTDDSPILAELEKLGIEIGQLEPSFMMICDYPDVENWPSKKEDPPDIRRPLQLLDEYCDHMERLAHDLPEDAGNDTLIPKYRKIPLMLRQAKHRSELHDFISVFEEFTGGAKPVKKVWKSSPAQLDEELARWNFFKDDVATPLIKQWQEYLYEPLLRAIMGGIRYYDAIRLDSGKLNFQDLLLHASRLLRDYPDIRAHFRKCYTHLLVDEFQDTDPIQAEVMLYLTSDDDTEKDWRNLKPFPGSLFVVGDPKQSIYRFRRADIITYNRVKHIILSSGGRVVTLSSNFRTIGPIIDWINDSFDSEFGLYPDHASPDYIPLLKGRTQINQSALEGVRKLVLPKDHSTTSKIVDYESDVIASFLNYSISQGLTVSRTPGETRAGLSDKARPEDFLIVTPTMRNMHIYNEKINRYGIPTEVTGGGSLNSTPQLFELFVLLKALVEPYNTIALVALLRGPLFGASDRDLHAFVLAGGEFNFSSPAPETLEPDFKFRLNEFFAKLHSYSKLLRKKPVIPAIEFIVADTGIQLLSAIGPNANISAGAISKTLEILRSYEHRLWTLNDYLRLIEELVTGHLKSDSAPLLPKKQSAVRIMNLHKAKGLEAPIVFLADPTGKHYQKPVLRVDRSQGESRGYIVISASIQGASRERLLALPPDWNTLADEETLFQAAEELRLKYVAATRAGSMLVVSHRPQYENKNLWSFFNSKLEGAKEVEHRGFATDRKAGQSIIKPDEIRCAGQKMANNLTSSLVPTYQTGSVKSVFTRLGKVSFAASRYGAEWGLAIHNMLEALMKSPETNPEEFRSVMLPGLELDPELWDEAIETVKKVLTSHIWNRALNSLEKFVEIPFSFCPEDEEVSKGKTIVRGVIDLAFREASGWTIVDYKSDRASESGLSHLIDLYGPQVRGYSHAWSQITGEEVVEAGLYFTHLEKYVVVPAD